MRKAIYVVRSGLSWSVKCDHCKSGIYTTQAAAISAARKHVGTLPQGTLSQILLQGSDAKWRAEWTYGKDPFPPRG